MYAQATDPAFQKLPTSFPRVLRSCSRTCLFSREGPSLSTSQGEKWVAGRHTQLCALSSAPPGGAVRSLLQRTHDQHEGL